MAGPGFASSERPLTPPGSHLQSYFSFRVRGKILLLLRAGRSMDEAIRKAEALIEALSYIRTFRDKLTVIKLGGSAMEDAEALRTTLHDVVFMETVGMRPILVHGGGKAIDRAMADAGLKPKKV